MAPLATKVTKRPYGATTFTDASDCGRAPGGSTVQLTVTGRGAFKARLTSLHLGHLHVLRGKEDLPRIAYVSLPLSGVFVSFPIGEAPLIWNGVELLSGDIVFHSRGERMHQRTTGAGRWGLIALPASQLASCGKSLRGLRIVSPPVGRVLRPQRAAAARLLGLHDRICRLAETGTGSVAPPAAARAMEQQLLHALVDCLTTGEAETNPKTRRRHAGVMVRFEEALATQNTRPLVVSEICAATGVPERTLRLCCAEFLGISPTRYVLLRRLNLVRSALRRADPASTSVTEIARNFQFSELGRFAVAYRTIFGETPSTTLYGTPG
jgi:AraC-like DNA-binding protein